MGCIMNRSNDFIKHKRGANVSHMFGGNKIKVIFLKLRDEVHVSAQVLTVKKQKNCKWE